MMRKNALFLLSIIMVFMTSMAFSTLYQSLSITAEVQFRLLSDIRVNEISLNSATGNAEIAYESTYTKNSVSTGFTLPTSGDSISYNVRIDNIGDDDYAIYDILRTTSDNGLQVVLSGYTVGDVIPAHSSLTLTLTYTTTNPSNDVISVGEKFDFRKVYYVTYETGTSEIIPAQVKYHGVNLTITTQQPTKQGYTFATWNTMGDGTGTNYNSGSTYAIDEDKVLYAQYVLASYNITYVLNNGTVSTANPDTYHYNDPTITLNNPTKSLTFTGHPNATAGANASEGTVTIGSNTTQAQTFAGWGDNNNLFDSSATPYMSDYYIMSDGSESPYSPYAIYQANVEPNTQYTIVNGEGGIVNPGYAIFNSNGTVVGGENYQGRDSITFTTPSTASYIRFTVRTAWIDRFVLEKSSNPGTIPTGSYGDKTFNAHYTAVAGTLPTVSKVGYDCGWSTSSTGTTVEYNSGAAFPITAIKENMSATVNLYAVCTPATYTVTAQANGGSIASSTGWTGTGNSATKTVTFDSAYGTLPTVSRTGYTFLGWNGKNMLEMSKWLNTFDSATRGTIVKGDNSVTITASSNDAYTNTYGNASSYQIPVKEDTTYTLSWSADSDNSGLVYVFMNNSTAAGYLKYKNNEDQKSMTFTTTADTTYITFRLGVAIAGESITYSNIQIEEGSSATTYEPYYISDSTIVTTPRDHTITAEWTPTPYTLTAQANGGTIASTNEWTGTGNTATKTVYYDSEYGTLPNVSRTGYTLLGWHGKNLFNQEDINTGKYLASTGDIYEQSDWAYSNYIEIEPGLTYTFNPNSSRGSVAYHCVYDTNKNFIQSYASGLNTITMPSNAKYIRVSYRTGNSTNMQLEKGTEATTYEPYYIDSNTIVTTPRDHTITAEWAINKYYLTYDYQENYSYSGANATNTGYKIDWSKNFKVESTFRIPTSDVRYVIFGTYNDAGNTLNYEVISNKLRVYMGAGVVDDLSTDSIPLNTDITSTFIWNAATKTYTVTATGTGVNISMSNTASSMAGTRNQNILIGRDERTSTFNPITISMFKISTQYTHGETISTLPTVSRPGYTYSGWYTAASGGSQVNSVTISGSDVTVYARPTAINYTLTYALNNGSVSPANPSGYTVDTPTITLNNPTKTLTFVGHTNATSGANAAEGLVTIGSNTTQAQTFAGWGDNNNLFDSSATPYKTEYYIKGDGTETSHTSFSLYKVNVEPNTQYTIVNSGKDSNPGYAIYDSSNARVAGEGYTYRDAVTFTTPNTASYIVFTVRTTSTSYIDSFVLEKSSNPATIPTGSTGNKTFNAHYTAVAGTLPTVTRRGYDCGWSTSSTGTDITYNSGASYPVSAIKENMSATVNLYAVCKPKKIHLTLDPSPGSGGTTNLWYYYGTSIFYTDSACTTTTSSITIPTWSGYTFDQYYHDGTSGGNPNERYIYSDGSFAGDLAEDIYQDATLYAKWTKSVADLNITISPTSYIYTGSALTPTVTVKDGNTTLTAGANNDYTVTYSNNTNIGTATITITGTEKINSTTHAAYTSTTTVTFTIKNAELTFNKGTCDSVMGAQKLYTRKNATAVYTGSMETTTTGTIPTAAKIGYTFDGWYNSPSGGSKVLNANGGFTGTAVTNYTNSNSWNTTADQTLYARCTPNTYTVTANANSGSISSTTGWTGTGNTATKTVTYDAAYGTLPTVSRSGYTFKGWSLLPAGYTQVEYVRFNGTQRIDTGVSPSTYNGNYYIEVEEKHTSTTGMYIVGGSFSNTTEGSRSNIQISNITTQTYVNKSDNSGHLSLNIADSLSLSALNKITFMVDSTNSTRTVIANDSFSTNQSAFISQSTSTFKISPLNSAMYSGDVYSLKIYGNGNLLRHLIPCTRNSDGEVGFYDIVGGSFYANTLTGDDLTAGSATYITSSSIVKTPKNHNIYAVWKDETAPAVSTATASTILDLRNYVDFTATDNGSGVAYYAINQSTTAPTTWIPVVSTVAATTETKYENSAAWARVFHQNNHWGDKYFANEAAAKSKTDDNDLYSVLGNITDYKDGNKWELLLQYPELSSTGYNRWTQTANPVTDSQANGSSVTPVAGYTAVHVDWSGSFGGLENSTSSSTLMDGSTGHGNWCYAIGVYTRYYSGMPGNCATTSTANLWARIDNLTKTTAASVSKRIGDIAADGTYYVWAKDAVGNTGYKAVTINKVDATKPTATITSTNSVAASQTATLTLGDNKGLDKYYWTTTAIAASTNPSYTSIDNAPTSFAPTKTISSEGTYYLYVVDKAGNKYETSKNFYKTTLNANNGTVSPASVITMDGNSFALPAPTREGFTFGGWYTDSGLTTAVTLTSGNYKPTASATLYAKWTSVSYKLVKISSANNNLLDNGSFENYKLIDVQTFGDSHTWDKSLNGVPGNTSKSYYSSGWGTGLNQGVEVPEVGYHAHMRVVDNNAVYRFKTNEDYAGNTGSGISGGSYKPGTVTANRWLGIAHVVTGISLTANKKYTISADVYRVSGSNYPRVGLYHASGTSTSKAFSSGQGYLIPTATGQWQRLSYTFTLSSSYNNAVDPSVYIYGMYGGNGEFYIDNISIEEESEITKAYDVAYTSSEIATPTKTGYTFVNWNNGKNSTALTTSSKFTTSTANFEAPGTANSLAYIYAKYTPVSNTMTINPYGGTYNSTTSNSSKSMTYDSSANNSIGAATRSTYAFQGWYTGASAGSYIYNTSGNNVALTDYWSAAYPDGAWKATANSTIYARWSKAISDSTVTKSVSNANLIYTGSAQGPTVTVTDTTASTNLASTSYTLSGNSNTNVNSYTITISGASKVDTGTKAYYTGSTTIGYNINNATITFDANGCGTISGTSPAYVRKGTTGVYTGIRNSTGGTIPTASKSGYVFNGWYDGSTRVIDGSGGIVASVSNWTDGSKNWLITANKTLKASCSNGVYAITLNQQNGSGGTATIYEKYGTGYYTNSGATTQMTTSANPITVPTRSGYTFGGYYTATSGGTQYIDSNGKLTSSASATNFTAEGTLYAKWTKAVSSLTNTLSATSYIYTGSAQGPTATVKDGSTTLTLNTDYTVSGNSNTNVSASYTVTITGKNVYNSTTKAYYSGSASLTYSIRNAKITWDTNSCGSINNSGTTPAYVKKGVTGIYTGETNTTAGTIPTLGKTGYTFNGWYDGSTKVINADKSIVASVANWTDANKYWLITADKTLKAGCSANVYTITLNKQSGTGGTGTIYEKYGSGYYTNSAATTQMTTSANPIEVPTRTGYTFNGYFTATSGGTKYIDSSGKLTSSASSTNFSANGNLYAQWSINAPTAALSGATTKIYGASATTLTCTNTTSYSGATLYYSFGYATSSNGTISNWTTAGTTNTLSISATEYVGVRYYKCRIYATVGSDTSSTTTSSQGTNTINNVTLTFNKGNCDSVSGTTPAYLHKNAQGLFQTISAETALATSNYAAGSKTGYDFGGWYTATNCGGSQVIDASKNIKASVSSWTDSSSKWLLTANNTVYACCNVHNYSISYTLNNGTNGSGNPSSYNITTNTITLANASKTITFKGNANSASGSNATSTLVSNGTVTIGSNTSKAQTFAGWTGSNGTTAQVNPNVTIPKGSTGNKSYTANWTAVAATLPTITRTGYACGWNAANNTTTKTWSSGGTYAASSIAQNSATTINLYGVCTPSTYTVSFDGNGATTAGTYTAVTATYDAAMPSISSYTKPAKTYNTFNGYWDTSAASGGTQYYTAALASARTWNKTANTKLYARWTPYTYTVSYNGNGNTGGSTASSTHTVGVAKALTANGFTKTNYTFAGWATTSDGSVAYSNQQSVTNLSTTNGATVTLYAKWTPVNYTLTVSSTCNSKTSHQCGTFDVTVGSTKVAEDQTSYSGSHPYNSSYTISDIKTANGATISSTSNITGTITAATSKSLAYSFSSKTFSYLGSVQSWKVPVAGTYTIEAYGAQGGNYSTAVLGGKGGYVKGNKSLSTVGQTLYIVTGQQPTTYAGGYNGGGAAGLYFANGSGSGATVSSSRGGGGATHVGTVNALLQNYTSAQRNATYVYVVAGGGGGADKADIISGTVNVGGVGGGATGGTGGYSGALNGNGGTGGSQSAGGYAPPYSSNNSGYAYTKGDFGKGGAGCNSIINQTTAAGGGAGWYGGGGGGRSNVTSGSKYYCSQPTAGGGGSSYTGSLGTTTTNAQGNNTGNGSVKFTWVS